MSADDQGGENTIVPVCGRPLAKPAQPLDPPDALEARVGRLEEDMKELKADVRELGSLRQDLAYLRGRVEHLPATWVLLTSITASQAALLGFTFALLRFLTPHQ